MPEQSRRFLALKSGESFCDGTLGGGGHALILAQDISPGGLLIGIDQDPWAIKAATARLKEERPPIRCHLIQGNFANLDELLLPLRIPGVDGFLFDLGVSSAQLDIPSRGFSYSRNAPLDMRMDPGNQTVTAAEIVNCFSQADLTRILRNFGQERQAARIAHRIVQAREQAPITTTSVLAQLVSAAIPARERRSGGNPAKRSFQALRIAVNRELEALSAGLDAAIRWLNPGGRIVVLSYHSLEDRLVKTRFAQLSESCSCPPEVPICRCGGQPVLARWARRALSASATEVAANPRSKSAKLRWAIKAS
jgi:16S rRNA (cytosine1402-N4)-methyltransferase